MDEVKSNYLTPEQMKEYHANEEKNKEELKEALEKMKFFENCEPKTNNRFIFVCDKIESFAVKSISLPKRDSGSSFNSPWYPLTLVLHDIITPSTAQMVSNWIDIQEQMGVRVKEAHIYALGPIGDVVSDWKLTDVYVQKVDYGELNYIDSSPSEIKLILYYSDAVLEY